MTTVGTQLQNKVEQLRTELAEAENKLADFQELPEVRQLATALHDKQCHWNHEDQCGWYYEKNWTDYAHNEYAEKAEKILAEVDIVGAMKVLDLI